MLEQLCSLLSGPLVLMSTDNVMIREKHLKSDFTHSDGSNGELPLKVLLGNRPLVCMVT